MVETYQFNKQHLNGVGVAVQHFPCYVKTRTDQRHAHNVVEFNYVVRGTGVHHLCDAHFASRPGSLGITHYGQQHDLSTEPTGMEVINCYLDLAGRPPLSLGEDLDSWLMRILPQHPSMSHVLRRHVHLDLGDNHPVGSILHHMVREQHAKRPGMGSALDALLRLLMVELARHVRDRELYNERLAESPTDIALERIRRLLEVRYDQAHTVAELARIAELSPHYLCRAFHQYTGRSLITYLHEVRLGRAMVRLRTSSDRISEIAFDVGFGDVSFFNRCFKSCTGTTPTKYRRNLLEIAETIATPSSRTAGQTR